MDTSKAAQRKAHARAIAQLLYEETETNNPEQLENFEGIEQAVRAHLLEHVSPEIAGLFHVSESKTSLGLLAKNRLASARE